MAVLEDSAQPQHTCSFLWRRNIKCRNKWRRAVFRELITSGELKKGNFQQGNKARGWLFPPFCHLSEIAVNKEGNFLALFIFPVSFISQVCSIALETSVSCYSLKEIFVSINTIQLNSLLYFPWSWNLPLSPHTYGAPGQEVFWQRVRFEGAQGLPCSFLVPSFFVLFPGILQTIPPSDCGWFLFLLCFVGLLPAEAAHLGANPAPHLKPQVDLEAEKQLIREVSWEGISQSVFD